MIKPRAICSVLLLSGSLATPLFSQSDSSTASREAIRLEMIEMRQTLNTYLNQKTASEAGGGQVYIELSKKWTALNDSLYKKLALQQQEIDSLKARLGRLEEKNISKPEVVTTKFENVLAVLYFDVGSASLSNEYKILIKKMVAENPNKVLQLVAYTDWVGNDEFNQKLSDQRAFSVQQELTANGFSIQNLKIYSRGKMAEEESEKLSAKECRRVEIRY